MMKIDMNYHIIIFLAFLCLTEGLGPVVKYTRNSRLRERFEKVKLLGDVSKDHWHTQLLDHFNVSDNRTWKQRFFVNEDFISKERNVAFLNINGEGYMISEPGLFTELAEKYKACTFELEHRFYGKSQPLKDMSLENLKYLSSEQALADIAAFIKAMNDEYKLSPNVKWIVFGGSYAGAMAAWARMKLPDLIQGAVSASGPILAKLNFQEYYGKLYEDFKETYGTECINQIDKAFKQVDEMLHNPEKHDEFNKIFKLCDPIQDTIKNNRTMDIYNFYDILLDVFAGPAQSGYNGDGTNPTGVSVCNSLSNSQLGDEVHRLAELTHEFRNGLRRCLDYRYAAEMEKLKDVTFKEFEIAGIRQWTYQTCTEFGYFQTSDHKPQIFGNTATLENRMRACTELFGDKYEKKFVVNSVERTNSIYGGLDLNNATNIVSVHGSKDPWSELGLKNTINPASPAIVIEGVTHCTVLEESENSDLPQLKAARAQISDLIGSWLK